MPLSPGARTLLAGGAAVLALTGLSLTALAAASDDDARTRTGTYDVACAPASVPGHRVTVTLGDPAGHLGRTGMMRGRTMAMRGWLRATPTTVPDGTVTFVAVNTGGLTHELVVLPLADGALAGQREVGYDGAVAEDDAITEASADCAAGTGDGILPGGAGWVTVRLAPGRYELACNLPGHYAAGMVDELVVR